MAEPADKQTTVIAELRAEHRADALGIGASRPRLSWIVKTDIPNWQQAGYEIRAMTADQQSFSASRVESDQSVLVPWPFASLTSREKITIRVRVWSENDESAWSDPYQIEAGLLAGSDWSARFITPDWAEHRKKEQPAPLLRREFDVRSAVTSARLYITALGLYDAQLNGKPIGDHIFDPGWTSYNHRLCYQTFDVTGLLQQGCNVISVTLGDGWFRGRLGWQGGRHNIYGDSLALLAQLELTYVDGSTERVVSDTNWRAATGPIVVNSVYDGETYDARLERPGWSASGFDDSDWKNVQLLERDLNTLVAPTGPPVRRIEELAPVALLKSPSGKTILDFGQNLVGWVRLSVAGPAGTTLTLRHAEILQKGELDESSLRDAKAIDRYILRGAGLETWEPRFTSHGFRYAQVEGWPGEPDINSFRAVVCYSDMERTGWFECSEPLVNKLHENVVWSMRGNFLSIPTDCPQRDERFGWTGDINVFSPTACFLYDTAGFLQSWLADVAVDQSDLDGVVPWVVPNILTEKDQKVPTAAWGDAAVVVPWTLYQRYGDSGILADQFASMKTWVDLVADRAGTNLIWEKGFQFGDWLDPNAPPNRSEKARTSPAIVATAYFAHSAELLGKIAGVLDRAEEATHYLDLADRVRAAFARKFVKRNKRLTSDATTAYALAIQFALLPDPAQREAAGKRLAELVRDSGYHISTGFVGTPLVCDALCAVGELDAAYRLLLQRESPSWLYPVLMGATTIWERWDSLKPDGSPNSASMNSYNHYALGAVADWLHRTVAGLAPAAPGYRRLRIQPQPGGGLSHAKASHKTPYGLAECSWSLTAGNMELNVIVPPNTTASVYLPGSNAAPLEVGSGSHHWSYSYDPPS